MDTLHKRFTHFLSLLSFLMVAVIGPEMPLQAQTVDATSLNNKVMAGYQGWFRTPGDQPENNGWAHWFNSAGPSVRTMAFDTWPDLSEYSAAEKYAVPGFAYADGSQAYLYSAQNYQTVLRHFQWMRTAGIDGVWLSQFCSHMPGGRSERDYPYMINVMNNVRKAATATGRTWAYMYDMSGLATNNVANIITNQWMRMVDAGVTSDDRYLHHDGKPVLLIWGYFPNRLPSTPEYSDPIVNFLLAPGKYQAALVGGGDPYWRRTGNEAFKSMLMRMTAWMPWQVGRVTVDPTTGYKSSDTRHWAEDAAICASNHVLYIPVVYSGTHIAGRPPVPPALPTVPRRNGNMLWEQFVAASQITGINSVFVAMFDEVNEGTEILKVANTAPTNANFITYEGATSDWYMRLVSLGEKMLRSHTPITMPVPISPFDEKLSYRIVNVSSGLALGVPAGAAGAPVALVTNTASIAGLEWQIVYDGRGHYQLKNKSAGSALGREATGDKIIGVQSSDASADNQQWEFDWDGTGGCKIKSKLDGKMLSGASSNSAPILQTTAANLDDVRWQIQDR